MTEDNKYTLRRELFYTALADIQGKLDAVPKTGYNSYSKYHYATMEDIMGVLTPALREYKLFLKLTTKQSEHKIIELNNAWYSFSVVTVQATVYDSYGNSESAEASGLSMDKNGDKSGFKADTGVSKYAVRFLFGMTTSDDEPEQASAIDYDRANTPKSEGLSAGGYW